MLRILYFSRDYTTHDHRFLTALAKTEHKVAFLRLENSGRQYESRDLPENIDLIDWSGGESKARFHHSAILLSSIRQVIHQYQPDIIQAGPIQTCAFLVALTNFQNLVTMSWGYDLLVDVDKNFLWKKATEFTLKRSASLVTDSSIIRERAIKYQMDPQNIVTFPWGVNINHFIPNVRKSSISLRENLNIPDDAFVLLSTRGWAPIYGTVELAHAFVTAASENPDLYLLMLGQGDQEGIIKHILKTGGVIDRVRFPGQVSHQDLPDYYRFSDLYISASHSDGSSISLLEAMACGCPVLLSDIPGNKEWIEPELQGWLFPERDIAALSTSIQAAFGSHSTLEQMGKAARLLCERKADWSKNFPHLFDAYDLALGN